MRITPHCSPQPNPREGRVGNVRMAYNHSRELLRFPDFLFNLLRALRVERFLVRG